MRQAGLNFKLLFPLKTKKLFSNHPISLKFYQPLNPKIRLSTDSLLKEDLNKIKVSLKLYNL